MYETLYIIFICVQLEMGKTKYNINMGNIYTNIVYNNK